MIAIMTNTLSAANFVFDKDNQHYHCEGSWSILNIDALSQCVKQITLPTRQQLIVNGAALTKFDSAGALTLMQFINTLKKQKNQVELTNFSQQQTDLLALIETKQTAIDYTPPAPQKHTTLYICQAWLFFVSSPHSSPPLLLPGEQALHLLHKLAA